MSTLDDHKDTLDLINTEIATRVARQAASGAQVDTKAALVAGVAATAAQFLATRSNPNTVLATLGYCFYAVAFLAAVGAYAVARYQDVPDPRSLMRWVNHTKAEALAHLAATRVGVFEANLKKHRRKVTLWWVSVAALGVGLTLSATAIVNTSTP